MFSLDSLKFIDSYQFLNQSLDVLVKNLINANHEFKMFHKFFEHEERRDLLLRKGVFPHSYIDNLDKLKETVLPDKDLFFNVLTNTSISDDDYEHAINVFKTFNCETISDYLELYQNSDTILLAEVFSSFRKTCLKDYELDPIHFLTSAELMWNAGLKYTKTEVKLLTNVNDYLWFERQMRGVISYLGKRICEANNPYIRETYDKSKPHNYVLALESF